jgi:hypothetical protein
LSGRIRVRRSLQSLERGERCRGREKHAAHGVREQHFTHALHADKEERN